MSQEFWIKTKSLASPRVITIQALKADETIYGGMLPKIESCEHAIDKGCKAALIFDGKNAANVSVILNEVHYALSHNDFSKLNYGTLITQ